MKKYVVIIALVGIGLVLLLLGLKIYFEFSLSRFGPVVKSEASHYTATWSPMEGSKGYEILRYTESCSDCIQISVSFWNSCDEGDCSLTQASFYNIVGPDDILKVMSLQDDDWVTIEADIKEN